MKEGGGECQINSWDESTVSYREAPRAHCAKLAG